LIWLELFGSSLLEAALLGSELFCPDFPNRFLKKFIVVDLLVNKKEKNIKQCLYSLIPKTGKR
jgi:hypothetical protein